MVAAQVCTFFFPITSSKNNFFLEKIPAACGIWKHNYSEFPFGIALQALCFLGMHFDTISCLSAERCPSQSREGVGGCLQHRPDPLAMSHACVNLVTGFRPCCSSASAVQAVAGLTWAEHQGVKQKAWKTFSEAASAWVTRRHLSCVCRGGGPLLFTAGAPSHHGQPLREGLAVWNCSTSVEPSDGHRHLVPWLWRCRRALPCHESYWDVRWAGGLLLRGLGSGLRNPLEPSWALACRPPALSREAACVLLKDRPPTPAPGRTALGTRWSRESVRPGPRRGSRVSPRRECRSCCSQCVCILEVILVVLLSSLPLTCCLQMLTQENEFRPIV